MLSPAELAQLTVAILVSRRHNAWIYSLRGCEDLDARYRAIEKILLKNHIPVSSDVAPEQLYRDLLGKVEASASLADGLNKKYAEGFPTKFGRLASYVLDHWDELPERQKELAREGERWIEDATSGWSAEFRGAMNRGLVYIARQLHLFTNLWLLRRLARLLDPAGLDAAWDFPGMSFAAVLDEEMEEIGRRRGGIAPSSADAGSPRQRADGMNLTGLAFSGGGIRSATFNLGVLQFLGESGMLRRFDYLSTVSGGGYIGAWLHGWIRNSDRRSADEAGRTGKGGRGIEEVEERLSPSGVADPQDPRVGPIRFLRRYSNYLTPQTGFLSADTWTMANIWVRNTFLNLLVLTMALSAVLLAPHWLAAITDRLDETPPASALHALTFGWLGSAGQGLKLEGLTDYWWVAMIVPAVLIGLNLAVFHPEEQLRRKWVPARLLGDRAILPLIVAPIFLAALGAGTAVATDLRHQPDIKVRLNKIQQDLSRRDRARVGGDRDAERQDLRKAVTDLEAERDRLAPLADADRIVVKGAVEFAFVTAMLVVLVSLWARLDLIFYRPGAGGFSWWRGMRAYLWILGVCAMAGVPSGALDYFWLHNVVGPHFGLESPMQIMETFTWGAPAFLTLLSITVFLYMGLLGRRFPDDRREWMARLGAWLGIVCVCWVAVCGTATYGTMIVDWLRGRVLAETGVGATWIATTLAGLLTAKKNTEEGGESTSLISGLIVKIAPPVFVVGLLLLLSDVLTHGLEQLTGSLAMSEGWPAFGLSATFAILALFLSGRVDINEFSLHQFYRNRLVRCYLGGARAADRSPEPFTGFDAKDDFPVSELAPSRGYSGPYPIFNTTLNVVHGDELAWQERKGESFFFTPRFAGFDVAHGRATHARTGDQPKLSYGGYRLTQEYAYPENRGIGVGSAITISGAAANPNMGNQTSASLAFLMTVLDVRLGWWLGNPRRTDTWRKAGPRTGLFQLLAELTANTNDTGPYINLSDGGHFENLGIYELVRRRCRFIVTCDVAEDHDYNFGDLGNAIRKCRTDFGVEIEIDVSDLWPEKGSRFTDQHYAVGTIRYPGDARGPGTEGTLIYLKSSLTGDESTDVTQFAMANERFPHESTANQWFDETRFESYRKLGYHVAESALAGTLLRVDSVPKADAARA